MPTSQRRDGAGLIDQLLEDPHRFEFFQAVRLLERTLTARCGAGADLLPPQLRFRNSLSLSFPASEIESLSVRWKKLEEDDDADRQPAVSGAPRDIDAIDITPAFMGLLGVCGAMPFVYTEQVAQRELYLKDTAARHFLDLFSHRLLALFYQAWKKSRLQFQYEADRRNRFVSMVLALAGMGQLPLNDRLRPEAGGVADEGLAFFAGALQQRTLSAPQLQQILSRYLKVEVRIEQFCGRWYRLPPEACTVLGLSGGQLGCNALAGERVWQRDLRARVVLGPLDHRLFQRFLPHAPGATALRELLTVLSGVSLEYEICIALRADAVCGSSLDSHRSPLSGRLGWDTYVQSHPSQTDRRDVRYDIHAAAA